MGIQHVVENKKAIIFSFIYDNDIYTFWYDKRNGKASIVKEIQFGGSSLALPFPQKTVGSKYLGVYNWQQLSQIPLDDLTEDETSYSALIEAKEKHQNSVLVLYNLNFDTYE